MQSKFSGFYTPSDEELKNVWNSDNVLFIFDTNVLLNLYTYTKETRRDFFKILEKLSDRVWLPYHVGLEYQRGRLNTIKNEKAVYRDIYRKIEGIKSVFKKDIEELNLKRRSPKLSEHTEILENEIGKLLNKYEKEVKKFDTKQPCVRSNDEIREELNKLFENRIGNKPENQKYLDELSKEGKVRFQNKIPPGYMDEKEKKNRPTFSFENLTYIPMFGDLILWKQIIEKAKEDDIESVIFISDDVKEDWIYYIDSNGKKDIGVRAELRQEIQKESNINIFEIYDTSNFLENSKENLSIGITDTSINEAKENTEEQRKINLEDFEKDAVIKIEGEVIKELSLKTLFNVLKNTKDNELQEVKIKRNKLMHSIGIINDELGLSIEKGHQEDQEYYLNELKRQKRDLRRINRYIRRQEE